MMTLPASCKNMLLKNICAKSGLRPSVLDNMLRSTSIDLSAPIEKAKFVVLDTELTGLDTKNDSIVSIGAIKFTENRIELGNFFYRVICPETHMKDESILIHGITPSETTHCPNINTLLPEFIDFCKNRIIIGHCISIDMAFINKEVRKLAGFNMQNFAADTYKMHSYIKRREENSDAYHEHKKEPAGLYSLAAAHGLSASSAHDALSDAFVTAQLFLLFISRLKTYGITTVRDLLRISKS